MFQVAKCSEGACLIFITLSGAMVVHGVELPGGLKNVLDLLNGVKTVSDFMDFSDQSLIYILYHSLILTFAVIGFFHSLSWLRSRVGCGTAEQRPFVEPEQRPGAEAEQRPGAAPTPTPDANAAMPRIPESGEVLARFPTLTVEALKTELRGRRLPVTGLKVGLNSYARGALPVGLRRTA
jgi:hypothetical protein